MPYGQNPNSTPSNGIKTKKYALPTKTYTSLALRHLWRAQWYWSFVPLALIVLNVVLNVAGWYPNWWIYLVVVLGALLYVLFWGIQFTGVTQLEQNKPMFQRYVYEIDGRQILLRINAKEGGVIRWDMVQSVYKNKEAFVLVMGKHQFLYLPFSIFNSDNDLRFMESLLRRKELLKEGN
ncbi:MAG: YcxB family protein [Cytophagaceae bacterium]|nr:YcxB family protein [Cytophagaceae bacterium]